MNESSTNSGPASEAPGRPCDRPGAHRPGPLDAELRTLAGPRKSGSDGVKGGGGRGAADRAPSGGRGPFFKTGGPGAGKMLTVELAAAEGGTTGFWRRLAAEAQTRAGGTCPGAGGGGAPGPLL